MGNTIWIAIGRTTDGARAYAMKGAQVLGHAHCESDAEALSALSNPANTIIRIGEGAADTVPCAVLPTAGHCLPVLTQDQPADVMGGWARLCVAGHVTRLPDWDGVICVQDGDVTHWVHVSASEIVSFASFLTYRLITALGGGVVPDAEAMTDSQSRPERLASHLRQAEVRGDPDAITGHLIGAELAAARVYWLGQQVSVIAPDAKGAPYAMALSAQGLTVTVQSSEDMIEVGLAALGQGSGLAG